MWFQGEVASIYLLYYYSYFCLRDHFLTFDTCFIFIHCVHIANFLIISSAYLEREDDWILLNFFSEFHVGSKQHGERHSWCVFMIQSAYHPSWFCLIWPTILFLFQLISWMLPDGSSAPWIVQTSLEMSDPAFNVPCFADNKNVVRDSTTGVTLDSVNCICHELDFVTSPQMHTADITRSESFVSVIKFHFHHGSFHLFIHFHCTRKTIKAMSSNNQSRVQEG